MNFNSAGDGRRACPMGFQEPFGTGDIFLYSFRKCTHCCAVSSIYMKFKQAPNLGATEHALLNNRLTTGCISIQRPRTNAHRGRTSEATSSTTSGTVGNDTAYRGSPTVPAGHAPDTTPMNTARILNPKYLGSMQTVRWKIGRSTSVYVCHTRWAPNGSFVSL